MVVLDFRFTYLIRDNVSMVHIVLPMYFQAGCLPNVLMMAKLSHRMDISTVPTWSTRKDISTVPTWSTRKDISTVPTWSTRKDISTVPTWSTRKDISTVPTWSTRKDISTVPTWSTRKDISTVPTWSTRKDISTVPTWSTPVAWPLKYSMSVFIQCCVNSRHVLIQNGVRMCGTVGDEFMRDN